MGEEFQGWMDSHEIEQYAYQLMMRNKWKSALQVVNKGLSLFPLNEDLLNLKLQILIKTKRLREIPETLKKYEILKGQTALTLMLKTVFIASQDPVKAIKLLLYELRRRDASVTVINFFVALIGYFVEKGYFKVEPSFRLVAQILNFHGSKVKGNIYTLLLLGEIVGYVSQKNLYSLITHGKILSNKGYWALWWYAGKHLLRRGRRGTTTFFATARKLAFPYFQKTLSFYLALAYLRDMRPQHAIRWINKVRVPMDRFPRLYWLKMYILARAYYMKGQVEESLFPLTEILTSSRKPSLYVQGLYARAMLRAYPNEQDRTRTFLKLLKVLRFPEDMLWCTTARLYYEQGNREKAISYLKERRILCESPLLEPFIWALYGTEMLTDEQKKLLRKLKEDDIRWTFLREEFLSLTSKWIKQL
ncbi:MAG: hypothetical protein GXO48_04085 [Chlorobi bacterium]|nr:hypothetical protein [Chlorobiota bacterium]